MTKGIFFRIFFILSLITGASSAFAQDLQESVIVGNIVKLQSKVLDEERTLVIGKPVGYDVSKESYPVIYILDGEDQFYHAVSTIRFLANQGRIPRALVVGLANIRRTYDFTPHKLNDGRESGGGQKFFEFLEKELFPYIESHYRVEPFRIIFGHSLTGMYVLHSLFTRPDCIHGVIAASPWITDVNEFVFDEAGEFLKEDLKRDHFYYITVGAEPEILDRVKKLSKLLKKKGPDTLVGDFEFMPQDDHGSVALKSIYNGLEMIFKGWLISRDELVGGKQVVESHFQRLSEQYGYRITVPENTVNTAGYLLLQDGKLKSAIEMFQYNVSLYPNSANVYDSLGEGLEKDGQFKKALDNYEIAVIKGTEEQSPFLDVFKEPCDRIKEKVE